FLAMNARGQRETGGRLGSFCIQCHAPMALRSGESEDGLNLKEMPAALRGVTCYFCHSVVKVEGTHNAPLVLADDRVVRAGIRDPASTPAHKAAYSPLLDREQPDSSTLCGSCHDIVAPEGAHIERTYAEWQNTLFVRSSNQLSCGGCHMEGRNG